MASFARLIALPGLLLSATDALSNLNPRDFSHLDLIPTTKRIGGDVALRLMPLGASITYGVESSPNGYREPLRELLMADGNPVDMVGSRQAGPMSDNDVEGWPGLRVDEVFEKAKTAIPEYLPNLVLINAGTNDCVQDFETDAVAVADRMLEMMQFIWKGSIKSTIVLSTLLPNKNASTEACLAKVNEQFRQLVEDQQAISKKVVLVDFHSEEGIGLEELVDDTHPTAAGYEHMAEMWFAGIKDAASRGWLEKPEDDPTPAPSPTDKPGAAASPTSSADVEPPSAGDAEGDEESASGGDAASGGGDSSSGDEMVDAAAEEAGETSGDETTTTTTTTTTSGATSLGPPCLTAAAAASLVLAMIAALGGT